VIRTGVIAALCCAGLLVILVLTATAVGNGRDHTGDVVRVNAWGDDVCGVVATWEGQLEALADDISVNNVGARPHDGGSGDSVEGRVYVRGVIDRAIDATQDTLQEGLKRAGIPDAPQGPQAAQTFAAWAQQTEDGLNAVQNVFDHRPATTAEAFTRLGAAVTGLQGSAVAGRAAFASVAALDPAYQTAFDRSGTCRRLQEDRP
jgi:hypothetical protein